MELATPVCLPNEDTRCRCYKDGFVCDPRLEEGCACERLPAPTPHPSEERPRRNSGYRFLWIEDETLFPQTGAVGLDLDAVCLTGVRSEVFCATAVHDLNMGEFSTDPTYQEEDILGPSDATCEEEQMGFVSLGGPGGRVVVSFGTDTEDIHIVEGDRIIIHDAGPGTCEGVGDEEGYSVWVGTSIAPDRGKAVKLGSFYGNGFVRVPALP